MELWRASTAYEKAEAAYDQAVAGSTEEELAAARASVAEAQAQLDILEQGPDPEELTAWQMLRALQQSGTAAQVEIEAVLNQIQAAMTPEQLAAIEEMDLTPGNMRAMFQELGLGMGRGEGSSGGQGGGFGPPPGVVPGSGGGRPGVPGVPGSGGGTDMSPEERATAIAERMSSGFGAALIDRLIELLEARAGES